MRKQERVGGPLRPGVTGGQKALRVLPRPAFRVGKESVISLFQHLQDIDGERGR